MTMQEARMKALVGAWDTRPQHVAAELAALRGRIKQLEQELARCREENAALRSELVEAPRLESRLESDELQVLTTASAAG
jgi:chromosome segregation ATPase